MFKSILRWLFRVKPAPAPAPAPVERPPMAVRNKPKAEKVAPWPIAESPISIICARQQEAIERFNSGPHGVRSAVENAMLKVALEGTPMPPYGTPEYRETLARIAASNSERAKRQAEERRIGSIENANRRQAEANRDITGHSVPGILD